MSCRTPFGSNTLAWTPFSSRQTKESSPSERMGCFPLFEGWGRGGKPAFRWKQGHMKKGFDILETLLKSNIGKAKIEAVR